MSIFGTRSTFENPHDAAVALRKLGTNIPINVLVASMQEHVKSVKAQVQEAIERTGLAKGLAGQRASKATLGGARSRAKRLKASDKVWVGVYSQGSYAAKPALIVRLWGLASLLEQGGRIRRHEIPFNTEQYAAAARVFSTRAAKGQLGPIRKMGLARLKGAGYDHPITVGLKRPSLHHPGAAVRARHTADVVLTRAAEALERAINAKLQQEIALVGVA